MARFSIVIPTYNRAHILPRTIASALNQSHPDVEVIVADDASTDNTEEVVRSYGDRVRYHRNPTNLGLWGNFGIAPELATGEFFSWLTDDDCVRQDFAQRATAALSASADITFYVCWAAYSRSVASLPKFTEIHGPLIPVDWLAGRAAVVDGLALSALNFFQTQAMPPAIACRTGAARVGVKNLLPNCLQYNEHVLATSIAAQGRVAIDPWIGVIHTFHDQQAHIVHSYDAKDMLRQKRAHADFCQRFMPSLPDRWRDVFRAILDQLPVETRRVLLTSGVHNPENRDRFWASVPPVVREMVTILLDSLPPGERHAYQHLLNPNPKLTPKKVLKQVVPPRVVQSLGAAYWTWKAYKPAPRSKS